LAWKLLFMIADPLSSALKGETEVDDPMLFESDTFPDSWNIAIGYVLAGVLTPEARKVIKETQFPDAKFGSFLANKLDASPSLIIAEGLSVAHDEFVRTLQSHSSTRVNLIDSGFLVPSDETVHFDLTACNTFAIHSYRDQLRPDGIPGFDESSEESLVTSFESTVVHLIHHSSLDGIEV
jgi:hypothetical protein